MPSGSLLWEFVPNGNGKISFGVYGTGARADRFVVGANAISRFANRIVTRYRFVNEALAVTSGDEEEPLRMVHKSQQYLIG